MYICQDNISECLWRPPQQNFPIFRAGLTKFRLQLLKQYGTAQRDDRPPLSLPTRSYFCKGGGGGRVLGMGRGGIN